MSNICAGRHEKELARPIRKNSIQADLHAFNCDPFMELRNDAVSKLDDPNITIVARHQIAAPPLAERAPEAKPRSITHFNAQPPVPCSSTARHCPSRQHLADVEGRFSVCRNPFAARNSAGTCIIGSDREMHQPKFVEHLAKVSGGSFDIIIRIEPVPHTDTACGWRHELPQSSSALRAHGEWIIFRLDPNDRVKQSRGKRVAQFGGRDPGQIGLATQKRRSRRFVLLRIPRGSGRHIRWILRFRRRCNLARCRPSAMNEQRKALPMLHLDPRIFGRRCRQHLGRRFE